MTDHESRVRAMVAAERIGAGEIITFTGEHDGQGREEVRLARWQERDMLAGQATRDIAEGEVVDYDSETGELG